MASITYGTRGAARKQNIRLQGLAIADDPLGPFEKCPLNPVLNSGHETGLFPFKEGIAALAIRHGNEHNTIQFAPDGINFEIASTVSLMPIAPGPYVPDAFTNTDNGRGITWGLCHFTGVGKHSILARFDCDLSQDHDAPNMRQTEHWWPPEYYYKSGLGEAMRGEREQIAREDLKKT